MSTTFLAQGPFYYSCFLPKIDDPSREQFQKNIKLPITLVTLIRIAQQDFVITKHLCRWETFKNRFSVCVCGGVRGRWGCLGRDTRRSDDNFWKYTLTFHIVVAGSLLFLLSCCVFQASWLVGFPCHRKNVEITDVHHLYPASPPPA